MKNKIIALLLSVLILLAMLPITSAAASSAAAVVAEKCTATQGGYAYVYIRADGFENIAVLDIELYYDSSVMSLSYTSTANLLSGASVSTNTATPGMVKISAMSATGLTSGTNSYNNRMMSVCFKVNSDCPIGDYPITVTVGDAYDSNLNPATISAVSGTVTVNKAAVKSFPLFGTLSDPEVKYGDVLSLKVSHYSTVNYSFASADFHVQYDRDLFSFESVELSSGLQKEDAVYSVNTSIQGFVVISYAATTAATVADLFTVKLKVIGDEDVSTAVTVDASDVYDDSLIAYAPYTLTNSVSVVKSEALPDYSDLSLTAPQLVVGRSDQLTLTLEGGAQVAAGDFTLTYDPAMLSVEEVAAAEEITSAGALVIINNAFSEGTVKFSYVNQEGFFADDMPLIRLSVKPLAEPSSHYTVSVEGEGVCDIDYNDINLEYLSASGCIFVPSVTDPTCDDGGYTTYTCPCGESYVSDKTPSLGHLFSGDWLDDLTHHFKKCENCSAIDEATKATHTYTLSETVCDICGHNRMISSVAVTTLPQKTEYTQYIDDLDISGAKLTVYYDDDSEKELALTEESVSGFDKNALGTQSVSVDYSGYKTSFEVTVSAINNAPHKKLYRIGLIEPWRLRICARMTDSASNTLDYSTFTDYGAYVIRKSLLCDIDTSLSKITPDQIISNENTVAYTKNDGMYIDGNYLCLDYNEEIYTYRLNEPIVWMMYYKTDEGTYCTGIAEKTLLELIESRKDSTSSTYTELEKKVYTAMYDLYNTVTDYRSDFDSPSLIKMQTPPNLNTTEVEFAAPATDGLVKFKRLQQIRLVEPWGIVLNMRAYLSADEGNSNAHIDYASADDYGIVVYHDVNDNIGSSEEMDEWQEITNYSDRDNVYVFNNLHGDMQLNGKYAYALYNKNIFTYQLDSEIHYMFFVKYDGKMYYSNVYETNIRTLTADRAVSASTTYTAKEKLVYRDMVLMCDAITEYREDYFANH